LHEENLRKNSRSQSGLAGLLKGRRLKVMTSPLMPFVAIIIAVVSIQFGAASAKQLFSESSAMAIVTLRLLLASTMLMLLWRPFKTRLNLAQLKALLFYGLSLGLMNLTFYLAIERISLGLAVALEFIGPLSLALYASRKKMDFLWALLAGMGIVFISPLADVSLVDGLGVFLALCAAMFWACYIICGHRVASIMHEGHATAFGMSVAALVILPLALCTGAQYDISWHILPDALLVALFSSAIPYSLEMHALKHLSKLSFGILMSLEPAMAAIMGFIRLNERLSLMHIFAIILITIASLGTAFAWVPKVQKQEN
jgi:inner membrane transporter RhtA